VPRVFGAQTRQEEVEAQRRREWTLASRGTAQLSPDMAV
jgi:hypothetical protein